MGGFPPPGCYSPLSRGRRGGPSILSSKRPKGMRRRMTTSLPPSLSRPRPFPPLQVRERSSQKRGRGRDPIWGLPSLTGTARRGGGRSRAQGQGGEDKKKRPFMLGRPFLLWDYVCRIGRSVGRQEIVGHLSAACKRGLIDLFFSSTRTCIKAQENTLFLDILVLEV